MFGVFAEQLVNGVAVFRQQVVEANTHVLFGEQFMGGLAVFRDQFTQTIPNTPTVAWGVLSEQFNGISAIFRDQFSFDEVEVPTPSPTKVSIRMLSSGKVRLINGRIQLCQT